MCVRMRVTKFTNDNDSQYHVGQPMEDVVCCYMLPSCHYELQFLAEHAIG